VTFGSGTRPASSIGKQVPSSTCSRQFLGRVASARCWCGWSIRPATSAVTRGIAPDKLAVFCNRPRAIRGAFSPTLVARESVGSFRAGLRRAVPGSSRPSGWVALDALPVRAAGCARRSASSLGGPPPAYAINPVRDLGPRVDDGTPLLPIPGGKSATATWGYGLDSGRRRPMLGRGTSRPASTCCCAIPGTTSPSDDVCQGSTSRHSPMRRHDADALRLGGADPRCGSAASARRGGCPRPADPRSALATAARPLGARRSSRRPNPLKRAASRCRRWTSSSRRRRALYRGNALIRRLGGPLPDAYVYESMACWARAAFNEITGIQVQART